MRIQRENLVARQRRLDEETAALVRKIATLTHWIEACEAKMSEGLRDEPEADGAFSATIVEIGSRGMNA